MKESLRRFISIFVIFSFSFHMILSPFLGQAAGRGSSLHVESRKHSRLPFSAKIYIVKPKDRLSILAKRYNITPYALKYINGVKIFSGKQDYLRPGVTLIVPKKPLSKFISRKFDQDIRSHKFDHIAHKGVQFLAEDSSLKKIARETVQKATNDINDVANVWLNQFGTANFGFSFDDKFHINTELSLLLPILDKRNFLLFSQGSMHRSDGRNQTNIGIGIRYFGIDYMAGGNGFVDYDLSEGHLRIGVGGEYWRNFIKLSTNVYLGLGNWRLSPLIASQDARAASGGDVRADFYLPWFPKLGLRTAYEQYFGCVNLANSADSAALLNDPYHAIFGVNYTPIPLITFSLDGRVLGSFSASRREFQTRLAIRTNYRLGVPLSMQLDGQQVDFIRRLSGSRYDLVSRNNNIILAYRERMKLKLYEYIEGYENSYKEIFSEAMDIPEKSKPQWDNPDNIELAKSCDTATTLSQCKVRLPAFKSDSANIYHLGFKLLNEGKEPVAQNIEIRILKNNSYQAKFFPGNDFVFPKEGGEITVEVLDEQGQLASLDVKELKLFASLREDGIEKKGKSLKSSREALKLFGKDGIYKASFPAKNEESFYLLEFYHLDEKLAEGSVRIIDLTQITVTLKKDRDNIPLSDAKGITLTAELRDRHGRPINNWADKLFLDIVEKRSNSKDDYRIIRALEEDSVVSGVYHQAVTGFHARTYKVFAYIKSLNGIQKPLNDEVCEISFMAANLPFSAKVTVDPESVEQTSGHDKARIVLNSWHEDGSFAFLGKDIFLSIRDKNNVEVQQLNASFEEDHYEANFRALSLDKLDVSLAPYEYVIVPLLGRKEFPEQQRGIINIYSAPFYSGEVEAILELDPKIVFLDEEVRLTLSLKKAKDQSFIDAPLKLIQIKLLENPEGADYSFGSLERISTGRYSVNFVGRSKLGFYKFGAYFQRAEVAQAVVQVTRQDIIFADQSKLYATPERQPVNDEKGIMLNFEARNGKGEALTGFVEKLRFEILYSETGAKNFYKVTQALHENGNGLYQQAILGKSKGTYQVIVYALNDEEEVALKKISIEFDDPPYIEDLFLSIYPDMIYDLGGAQADNPSETEVSLESRDKEGLFFYLGEEVPFIVYDEMGQPIYKFFAVKSSDSYYAKIDASAINSVIEGKELYKFTIRPDIQGASVQASLKIWKDLNLDNYKINFYYEDNTLYLGESTKGFIEITDSKTGEATDLPGSGAFTIGLAEVNCSEGNFPNMKENRIEGSFCKSTFSSDQSVVSKPSHGPEPGSYTTIFKAGKKISGCYKASVYYGRRLLAHTYVRVCNPAPDRRKSSVKSDRDNISITDKDGIQIIFEARDGCNFLVKNLKDKLHFEVKDQKGSIDNYRALTEIYVNEAGAYVQHISGNAAGPYEVTPYVTYGPGVVQDFSTIKVFFRGAVSPSKSDLKLTPDEIWQDATHVNETHISFKPMHADNTLAYLGEKVIFRVKYNDEILKEYDGFIENGAYRILLKASDLDLSAFNAHNGMYNLIVEAVLVGSPHTIYRRARLKLHSTLP